jgi:hypothetical protein
MTEYDPLFKIKMNYKPVKGLRLESIDWTVRVSIKNLLIRKSY